MSGRGVRSQSAAIPSIEPQILNIAEKAMGRNDFCVQMAVLCAWRGVFYG